MWKAHDGIFNGTVEQLCPITFLSGITRLEQRVNLSELQGVLRSRDRNAGQRAADGCADKRACGEVCVFMFPGHRRD